MRSRPQPIIDRPGLVIGVAVGLPVTVAVAAAMATARSFFNGTNAALVLMIVVVAIAALGGRTSGIITALAAVVSFDFFHTRPYLSLTIDSRDDVETTVLLLVAAVFVGTIATAGRFARRRESTARAELRRIHRVAEAAASGTDPAGVIEIAQDELRALLQLRESRFEALPVDPTAPLPRLGRSGAIETAPRDVRFVVAVDGRSGFELPLSGVELPVLARGQQIGRFVLIPTPGVPAVLEDRLVAVAIADQVGAVWLPSRQEPA
jgi:hypothetical protein